MSPATDVPFQDCKSIWLLSLLFHVQVYPSRCWLYLLLDIVIPHNLHFPNPAGWLRNTSSPSINSSTCSSPHCKCYWALNLKCSFECHIDQSHVHWSNKIIYPNINLWAPIWLAKTTERILTSHGLPSRTAIGNQATKHLTEVKVKFSYCDQIKLFMFNLNVIS